ncbi:MAG TPA: hypothetical protein VFR81_12250 [Longimicrobium sp.]|nr:hypothetical protein [Longimicrobium sp.]
MPTTRTPEEVARRFAELAEIWREETEFHSSSTALFMHYAYQQIIGLGPDVVPLLLADLPVTHSNWYWALLSITGENPVPQEERGRIPMMEQRWLEWGRERGLI